MIKAILRRGDGLPSGRPWLRSVVRTLQRGLAHSGQAVGVDGKFGGGTARALGDFQSQVGLEPTWVAEPPTWRALDPHLASAPDPLAERVATELPRFRGDIDWVHDQEGHRGRPYWPGGASGVTLDPGVDLGHAPLSLVAELYRGLLRPGELRALARVAGLTGEAARAALRAEPAVAAIRIARGEATALMPYAAKAYWEGIRRRFPAFALATCPPSVQTVGLSLAYNRGVFNRGLEVLAAPIEARDWAAFAGAVGRMQQHHGLRGIRERRRREAALVAAELEFMAA